MSFAHLVYAYFLGGLTFIPILIASFFFLHPKKAPQPPEDTLKAGEIEEYTETGLGSFKQGWIFVTHEDLESQDEISAKTESVAESHEVKSAYSSLYKLVSNSAKGALGGPTVSEGAANSDSSFATNSTSPPKTSAASKKHRYYAVLKHGNLFLYKNERLQDVKHVIVLSNHIVSIWPRTLSEASLYTKYSSIAILKNDWSRTRRLSDNSFSGASGASGSFSGGDKKITIHDVLRADSGLPAPPGTIFVYTELNIDKEDWYFALIRATKTETPGPSALDPAVHAQTMHLETKSMISLIQTLYGSEGQLQAKWFNAIVGRVFLSLQRTEAMQNYLTAKIERKLNKMKTPGFLDKFQITSVDAGNAAPTVTFPLLKEINPEGDLLVSFNFHYTGGMAMQLATKATINLGSRFKTREVDVLMSVTLERISGPMLVRIKAPPSARMWYTYEREPDVSIKIEPVISQRQMSYNIITNTIEKKFKDAIKESLVLPHWDDIVFCPTPNELYRGGIWERPEPEQTETTKSENSEMSEKSEKPEKSEKSENTEQKTPASSLHDAASEVSVETASEPSEEHRTDVKEPPTSHSDTSLADVAPLSQKAKVSKTISDFSRRLRKPKSAHTLSIDETSCLSDGSVLEPTRPSPVSVASAESGPVSPLLKSESPHGVSTLRKIGEWYAKSDKSSTAKSGAGSASGAAPTYHPPEMISNRRGRKNSSATINSDVDKAENTETPAITEHTDGAGTNTGISGIPPVPSYDFGQELSGGVFRRPSDLGSPRKAKPVPPTLPPRENRAPGLAPVTVIAEPVAGSGSLDTFIEKVILSPETGQTGESGENENKSEEHGANEEILETESAECAESAIEQSSHPGDGEMPSLLPSAPILPRSNTVASRKPPPYSSEPIENVLTISTAPI